MQADEAAQSDPRAEGDSVRHPAGWIVRRPAIIVAALFILGVASHTVLPHWPWIWVIAAVACCIAARIGSNQRTRAFAWLPAVVFVGATAAQLSAYYYRVDHISVFASDTAKLAQIELIIDDPPRILSNAFGQYRALPPKQVTTASVTRIRTWTGWTKASGLVLVQIAEPHPRLAIGQRVRVLGWIERPAPAMNPGQFDWADYYRDQRILASVQIAHADNIQILADPGPGLIGWLRERTRRLLAMGFPAARSLDHALLRALLLGDSDPELRDIQEQFRRTGTSHHLAISGMHVAVLGMAVYGLCRVLRVRPRWACWLSLILVIFYGLMALPSPPVVRSVVLCVAFAIGVMGRRTCDGLQLLAISVLAMLAYEPLDLYNAGFQLSFGTVLGLMLFGQPILAFLTRLDEDTAVLIKIQRQTSRQIFFRKLKAGIWATLSAGAIAWIVSAPLIAVHFEQLNPWAIPASIILAPIVFVALIGGFLKVLLTLLLPGLSTIWATIATLPMIAMRKTVDWLARFPGADVPLPAPSIWVVVCFYALLLAFLIPWPRKTIAGKVLAWCARCTSAAGCVMLAALPLLTGLSRVNPDRELRITLLAVGAGQCAVIQPPNAAAVLIDAGSISLNDPVRKCIGPFLRHMGLRSIGTLILSHSDYDHISAAGQVVMAYDVPDVIASPAFRRTAIGNPPAETLLELLDSIDRSPRVVHLGENIPIGKDASLRILWPPEKQGPSSESSNNAGLVLKLTFAGRSVLFPADTQAPAHRELLKDRPSLKADILVAPHHGSIEETTPALLAAVDPQFIISSNDRTPSMKQRDFDDLTHGKALRTNRCGAITIRIGADGSLAVEPFLSADRQQVSR